MRGNPLTIEGRAITLELALTLAALNLAMVLTVFIRRMVKQRWFSRRDDSRLEWAQVLDACVKSGVLPARKPARNSRLEMGAAEAVLLERWSAAGIETRPLLYSLFRHWRLLDFRLMRLRRGGRWEQARSSLVLGKMRCLQAMADIRNLLKRTQDVAFIQALEYLGDASAIRPLLDVLATQQGSRRILNVISALVHCARDRPQELVPYLTDESVQVRETAAAVLAEVASAGQVDALIAAATDSHSEVRAKVARALARSGELRAVPCLQKLATDSVWFVRLHAIATLVGLRQADLRETFLHALKDENWRVREKAALGLFHSMDNVAQLFACFEAAPDAHDVLVSTLDRHGITWDLLDGLSSPDPTVEHESCELIIRLLKGHRTATVLSGVASHPQQQVRQELARLVQENAAPNIRSQCREITSAWNLAEGQLAVAAPRLAAAERP